MVYIIYNIIQIDHIMNDDIWKIIFIELWCSTFIGLSTVIWLMLKNMYSICNIVDMVAQIMEKEANGSRGIDNWNKPKSG